MKRFLIKTFIKDHENTKDPKVRNSYSKLAGAVGIVTNTVLCTLKIVAGLIFNSVAILADGINNLADASSSIILLIGVKLASKPADEDHPYGHARIEYITGLIISFLIIIIGVQLLFKSIDKIRNPEPTEFSYITLIILALAIAVKIWQALFNISIGKAINSSAIKATGTDSRNDVISTSAVLISIVVSEISGLQLDGIMGALVALFIIFSGIQLILETSSPLLGSAPDEQLVEDIQNIIRSFDGVIGTHDLAVHNYGPGRIFASVHIEVNAEEDPIASHDMIDNIERAIKEELKVELVAHTDPLDTNDPLTAEVYETLQNVIRDIPGVKEFHDLRIVTGYTHKNIVFDVVMTPYCNMSETELKKLLDQKIKELSVNYYSVITIDKSYIK